MLKELWREQKTVGSLESEIWVNAGRHDRIALQEENKLLKKESKKKKKKSSEKVSSKE